MQVPDGVQRTLFPCPYRGRTPTCSAGLSAEHRREFVGSLSTEEFPRGAYIVREGEPGNRFYVITRGEALVTKLRGSVEEVITHLYEVRTAVTRWGVGGGKGQPPVSGLSATHGMCGRPTPTPTTPPPTNRARTRAALCFAHAALLPSHARAVRRCPPRATSLGRHRW